MSIPFLLIIVNPFVPVTILHTSHTYFFYYSLVDFGTNQEVSLLFV